MGNAGEMFDGVRVFGEGKWRKGSSKEETCICFLIFEGYYERGETDDSSVSAVRPRNPRGC